MFKDIKIKLQYLLPKQLITQCFGWLAAREATWLTQCMIKAFAAYYKIDMLDAQEQEFSSYPTFNAFFTRSLRPDARPIRNEPNTLTLPVDGIISQLGTIDNGKLIQAKKHDFSLTALLAGNERLVAQFQNGLFITLYLAPNLK